MLTKHPNDGREYKRRCGRCGSAIEWTECDCDEGRIYDDDGIDDECEICDGHGGWNCCANVPSWCQANPLEGRENVERGAVKLVLMEGAC